MTQNITKVETNTSYGPQYIGSALSYHVPLMNPVKPPSGEQHPRGSLCFPTNIEMEMPSLIIENKSKWENLELTMDQKPRVTASNFGKIMKRKSTVTNTFLNSFFKRQEFILKPTAYGKANERVAKQILKKTNHHAHDIELIINPEFPYLGATPDGKVCDKGESGILEIECPYTVRDMTLSEACTHEKYEPYLFLIQTDHKCSLLKDHEYWFQVQGQLLLTGAKSCDFVTFTRNIFHVERIYPDKNTFQDMLKNLQILLNDFK
ncbi:LOW QUALITY PROTEIN: hypothetical protein KUTeg_011941 [Tegillarca granosa]|uniref:YqaJ viral recombinase domain-containing protein n=1 Tax=Tegillarca granosa TaxID=220873 RepID=A0ABQ9F1J7_TEGGR|nr:LOW QUALITY PROTEIN: hypothetical protein KUTeg_011941 [Tegillarca granosa]